MQGVVEIIPIFQVQPASRPWDPCPLFHVEILRNSSRSLRKLSHDTRAKCHSNGLAEIMYRFQVEQRKQDDQVNDDLLHKTLQNHVLGEDLEDVPTPPALLPPAATASPGSSHKITSMLVSRKSNYHLPGTSLELHHVRPNSSTKTPPAHKPPASMSSSARRLQNEPLDESPAWKPPPAG